LHEDFFVTHTERDGTPTVRGDEVLGDTAPTRPAGGSPTGVSWTLLFEYLLTALVAAWIAQTAYDLLDVAWKFTTDDAYISLRYGRHLAQGHGLVWNVGEDPPVEGYSNFLFVLLGAFAYTVGWDPVLTLKIAGLIGFALSPLLLWYVARTWMGPIAALVPTVFLATYRGQVLWAVSGLETTAFQALALAAFAAYVRGLGFRTTRSNSAPVFERADNPESHAAPSLISYRWLGVSGILLLLTTLTRPEAVVVAGAFAVGLAWRVRLDARAWATVTLTFLLPFAAYHLWRLDYFGALLPHSAVCKSRAVLRATPLTKDLANLLSPIALLAAIYPWRKLGSRHVVMWLVPIAYGFVLDGVDPVIGYWNRHGLLAYALTLLAAAVGLHEASKIIWPRARRLVRESLLLTLVLAYSATFVEDPTAAIDKQASRYARRSEQRAAAAAWFAERVKPSDWIVLGDDGQIPYELDAKVMDTFCLNSLEFTNPPIDWNATRFADYIYRLKPRFVVVHSRSRTQLKPLAAYGTNPALVKNPDFRLFYTKRAVFGPPGDPFYYWVYERRGSEAPSKGPSR